MIAVVSVPAAAADTLPGRRITPWGAREAGRAYSLAGLENPYPRFGTATVLFKDDDSSEVRWFATDEDACLWATLDALNRLDEQERYWE